MSPDGLTQDLSKLSVRDERKGELRNLHFVDAICVTIDDENERQSEVLIVEFKAPHKLPRKAICNVLNGQNIDIQKEVVDGQTTPADKDKD